MPPPLPLRFAAVLDLPAELQPGTVYLVARDESDEIDVVYADVEGDPRAQRVGHVQMAIESTPGLLPADAVIGRYYAPEPMRFLQALSGLRADITATNESVLPVYLGGDVVARARFVPGDREAVIEILEPGVIAAPAMLVFRTPAVQDPTLSGVVGTFVAQRV